jgi:hypothetical protein
MDFKSVEDVIDAVKNFTVYKQCIQFALSYIELCNNDRDNKWFHLIVEQLIIDDIDNDEAKFEYVEDEIGIHLEFVSGKMDNLCSISTYMLYRLYDITDNDWRTFVIIRDTLILCSSIINSSSIKKILQIPIREIASINDADLKYYQGNMLDNSAVNECMEYMDLFDINDRIAVLIGMYVYSRIIKDKMCMQSKSQDYNIAYLVWMMSEMIDDNKQNHHSFKHYELPIRIISLMVKDKYCIDSTKKMIINNFRKLHPQLSDNDIKSINKVIHSSMNKKMKESMMTTKTPTSKKPYVPPQKQTPKKLFNLLPGELMFYNN